MAANDNALTCDNKELTLSELFAAAIGKDASGKPYLRYYTATNVSGSKFFDCGNPVDDQNVENVFRNLFALDVNGDIAIRVGTA